MRKMSLNRIAAENQHAIKSRFETQSKIIAISLCDIANRRTFLGQIPRVESVNFTCRVYKLHVSCLQTSRVMFANFTCYVSFFDVLCVPESQELSPNYVKIFLRFRLSFRHFSHVSALLIFLLPNRFVVSSRHARNMFFCKKLGSFSYFSIILRIFVFGKLKVHYDECKLSNSLNVK